MEFAFSKLIKRRQPSVHVPSPEEGEEGKEFFENIQQQPVEQWLPMQDAFGRHCWQSSLTGNITYGNGSTHTTPQQEVQPHNPPSAGNAGASKDRPTANKPKKQPAAPVAQPPVAVGVPFIAPPPGAGVYAQGPVGITNSPVPYQAPGVVFGTSPVPMYPVAPWNPGGAAPVSPFPYHNPEQARRMQEQARKKKEEAEKKKKKAQEGTWERYYTDEGRTFWQHTGTGKRVNRDPYF